MSQPLESVLWMGGSPCSGKSEISRLLAGKYQLNVYHCDDHFARQAAAADPRRQPTLYRLNGMSWDEIFSRPVAVQVRAQIEIYRELFATILEEVRRLANDGPLLVEGAALLPEQIDRVRGIAGHVIYVVTTPSFQRATYARREWPHAILGECRDPEGAFANWMARDEVYARLVTAQARARGMGVLTVSGARTVEENAAIVAGYFGLDGTERPRGATVVVYRQGSAGREFLLLHRSAEGPSYEGDWAWTPPAGVREPGEAIEDCAARELQEETGLSLTLRRVAGGPDDWALFVAEAPAGARIRLDAEHDRYQWLPLDRALARVRPSFVAEALRHAAAAAPG